MLDRLLNKLFTGSECRERSTRFHDENNVFMGWPGFRELPRTLVTTAQRRLFGKLPILPWWPYPAIEAIDKLLTRDFVVLEYGIGMSTVWLAQRAGKVQGIEHSPEWFFDVTEHLRMLHLSNVSLHFRPVETRADGSVDWNEFAETFSSLDSLPEKRSIWL